MRNSVKHISFDVWQTLINSNVIFREKRNELLQDHFNVDIAVERFGEIVKKRQAWCTIANQVVGRNFDSFEIILLILQDCGQSVEELTIDSYTAFYEAMEKLFFKFPPILIEENLHSLFTQLQKQEVGLSLLSNTGLIKGRSLRQFFASQDLLKYFNFELYSDEIGVSKPNTKAFEKVYELASRRINLQPQEVVHIGDNKIADYEGALTFGFQPVLIDHTEITLHNYFTKNVFNLRQKQN
jgi:putative hydrolase of the HAD superfamily